jgi:hypothetical protein
MSENRAWFHETSSRAKAVSDAYRKRLGMLWWANLMFVVAPAVSATAAAILAALPPQPSPILGLPLASVLAAAAAILTAVHKALKCDEYQAECHRLGQAYEAIAIDAHSVAAAPDAGADSAQARLTRELVDLTRNAQARVATSFLTTPA